MTAGAPTQPLLGLTASGAPPGESPPREEPPEGIPFASALNAQQARTAVAEGHQQEARQQQAHRAEREAEQAHRGSLPPGGEQAISQGAAAGAAGMQTAAATGAGVHKDAGKAAGPTSALPAGEPFGGDSAASAAAGNLAAGGPEGSGANGALAGALGAAALAARGSGELGDGAAAQDDAQVLAPERNTAGTASPSSATPSAPDPQDGSGRGHALASALATAATSDPGATADLAPASPGVREHGGLATDGSPVQPGASAPTQPAANPAPGQGELDTAIGSLLGNRARSSSPSSAGEAPGSPLGETQSSALPHGSNAAHELSGLRALSSAQASDTPQAFDTTQVLDAGHSAGSTAGALHDATRGTTDATAGGVAPGVGSVEPGVAFASALGVSAGASQGAAPGEDAQAPLLGAEVGLQQALDDLGGTIQLATSRGLAQARIALAPAELGEIRIHLTQTANGLLARVTADSPAVAQALASGHGELRQTLSSLGVDLAGVEVGQHQQLAAHGEGAAAHHGRDGAAGRGESAPRGTRPNATAAEEAAGGAPAESETATPVPPERRGALVDVLA